MEVKRMRKLRNWVKTLFNVRLNEDESMEWVWNQAYDIPETVLDKVRVDELEFFNREGEGMFHQQIAFNLGYC